jgi:glycosyltransferase involved in cell wall biosynthesis
MLRGELGVDLTPLSRDERPLAAGRASPRLACIASRDARKRVINVLRTVALLSERHPRVHLSIGGPAAQEEELRIHAASLNIGRLVEFHQSGAESEALRSAQLAWVVADGDDAAFGCLHAMARGIPVLTEQSAVTAHFIEQGVHGTLFPALEPPAMAADVSVYVAQPGRREAAGRAARHRISRQFTEREMANGFEQATRMVRESSREHA